MKLARFGASGTEKPGIVDANGVLRDLSDHLADIDGGSLTPENLNKLALIDVNSLPVVPGNHRIGPCISRPGKFIAIGLNYYDHAHEMGMNIPAEPVVFMKATSSICGPFDDYECPKETSKLDWEVELGVVIGTRAKNITQEHALDHVAGYCTVNDGSERVTQLEQGGQWTKGKSHDTFGPVGPWLVTKDEIPDTGSLDLMAEVDGKRMQDGSTKTMIFSVPEIIAYLSTLMTLEPGDLIATGTPPGVGGGMKPEPVFLKPGNQLDVEVIGLGRQSHRVVMTT